MDVNRLSPSGLRLLQMCGEAFRRRYVEGERSGYGLPAAIGSATHKSAEQDLNHKKDTGELLAAEAIPDLAADAFEDQVGGDEFELEAEERASKATVLAAGKDQAIALASLHHTGLAPSLRPMYVEQRLELEVPGFPVTLLGFADLIESSGVIRDLKTRRSKPRATDAEDDLGLAFYSMAADVIYDIQPPSLVLDVLVKTKTPKIAQVTAVPDRGHARLTRRIERAVSLIQAGTYLPADPSHWKCSQKFCDFFDDCPWGRRDRKQI